MQDANPRDREHACLQNNPCSASSGQHLVCGATRRYDECNKNCRIYDALPRRCPRSLSFGSRTASGSYAHRANAHILSCIQATRPTWQSSGIQNRSTSRLKSSHARRSKQSSASKWLTPTDFEPRWTTHSSLRVMQRRVGGPAPG